MKIIGNIDKYPRAADDSVLIPELGYIKEPLLIPCGKCIACRVNKAEEWADRITLEMTKYPYNYFLTITYDDDHIPENGSLKYKDVTDFIKRWRERIRYERINKNDDNMGLIRYYYAGEYGNETLRPHYHACIFTSDEIKKMIEYNPYRQKGYAIYTSEWLNKIWGKGDIKIGTLTHESARYTAKYMLKADDKELFESRGLEKPASRMSRRPGIASDIIEEIGKDIITGKEELYTTAGHKLKIPKYYKKKLEEKEDGYDIVRENAKKTIIEKERTIKRNSFNNRTTAERLAIQEVIQNEKTKTKRS